ncbi:DUF1302 domain-containing protein [Pseudomonas sp. GCEP-101]|uniref:DUF1302 domain-containing protein n=1 Tax=Pseudomonas sp. GCEP-101 TaxID=2974552 RepID=UPI00223C0D1E|nr:DUF1302 domain-containing protein [Pseudomonas sp. GCEP-101]
MNRRLPALRLLALPAAIALALYGAGAQAFTFSLGEIEGQFDSSLSVGASWAMRNADAGLLHSASSDDGKRNFREGETFSKVFKGIHDLELKYGDSGAFVRGKYWYDFKLKDDDLHFRNIDDHGREEGAKASGAEFLDAFLYHNYSIGDLPGTVRLGKQVVSWGESTFIQGGINAINPIDVAAFRRPGSEIKEGLIPVNMFYVSQNFSDHLSAEAFYQLQWQKTVIDNCGTFFSTTDVMADGCNGLAAGPVINQNALAVQALAPLGVNLTDEGIVIPRGKDREARDGGQWGTALRWFAPELDSEFAGYFINYHSRQPYLSVRGGPHIADLGFAPQLCGNLGLPNGLCGAVMGSSAGQQLTQAYRLGSAQYFADYPEDIQLYGLSFSTSLPTGTTLAGEISYRPNMPVQINPVDVVTATLGIPALTPVYGDAPAPANDAILKGYRRKEVTQAQVTATHFFDQVMGADRLTLIGEVGLTHVGGLGGKDELRYGRSPVFGQGALYPDNSLCTGNSATPQYCNDSGFVTSNAWGYQARAIWEYADLIDGATVRPNLAWSHDVHGYAPEPGFNQGARAISVGVDGTYLNTYNMSLSYTNFFGGDYNVNTDRDFVALSLGVSF